MKIESITGRVHDTNPGPMGYPYKVVVEVSLPIKEFEKLCPKTGPSENTIFGRRPCHRDLGSLVVLVNNAVYAINQSIPAHNPSIDSKGSKRSKNGIKTMEFVYFFRDHERAANLGFKQIRFKSGEIYPDYAQHVRIAK